MPEAAETRDSAPSTGIAVVDLAPPLASAEEARLASAAISRALRRSAFKARAPVRVFSGGSGFQTRRGDRAFRLGVIASFCVFLAAPLLAASLYWGLWASKQYVTEAKFALRAGEASMLDSLSGLTGLPASQQAQDAQIVTNYIRGRAMVEALDREIDLRGKFSRAEADYFSSFDRSDPIEDLEKYWRKRVDSSIDNMSGIISVSVRAFTPEDSLDILTRVIDLSEKLVNDISTRSRRDALEQSRAELARAEQRLKSATASMREARDAEGVIDAPAAAEAINKIITALRMELSRAEESLAVQASAAVSEAPQGRLLRARAQSLKDQIANYSAQIAGDNSKGGDNLAGRAGVLSTHQLELDFARQQYAVASIAFENARVDVETQHAYLVSFLRPTLAEKSTYPRRWLEWSIIVVPATLGWAVLIAIAFLARDHMVK
jgi:capsular polysaccharide transport system permease protein